jgi:hypothetical protein
MSKEHKPRRRGLAEAAAIGAAAALVAIPGAASAEGWKGVVVGVDAKRRTVATATGPGEVRTLRVAPRIARRTRLGHRVRVDARALGDGTYRARTVRRRGTSKVARIRGSVVAARGPRLLVSAGDSVLEVRAPRSRQTHARSAAALGPGDVIAARVRLRGRTIRATHVRDVGDVAMIEVEGIVLGLADGVLRLAVAGRGQVLIAVPEGALPVPPAVGAEIETAVSVADDGTLTLVALASDEDEDHGLDVDGHGDEIEAEGVIAALSSDAIAIRLGVTTLECDVPEGVDLSLFAVGDDIDVKCRRVGDALVLERLRSERIELEVHDDGTVSVEEQDERSHDGPEDDDDDEDEDEDDGDDDDDDEDEDGDRSGSNRGRR